ncbi:MAG: hypothetical protein JWO38_2973 [Gemmataceae bacterium]|nr:hypothetical protein [Gemmataceae bacterium]
MSAGTRRWWRAAALTLIGGAVVGSGWFGLTRSARAEPVVTPLAPLSPQQPKDNGPVWTRAAAPIGSLPASPAKTSDPAPGAVTPAAAVIPVAPPTVVPAVRTPSAPIPLEPVPVVTPPALGIPLSGPVTPATGPAVPAPLPVPEFKLVTPPPVVAPVGGTDDKMKPVVPPLPDASRPPAPLPLPSPTPFPPPRALVEGKTGDKSGLMVPPPPGLAPTAPPSNSAGPMKPVPPVGPDFTLRPGNDGHNVKSDTAPAVTSPKPSPAPGPVGPAVPAIPVGSEPGKAPPVRSADRPKPAEGPVEPSDKYVFPALTTPSGQPGVTGATIPPSFPGGVTTRPVGTGTASPGAIGTGPTKPDTTATTPGDIPMNLKQSAIAAAIGGALAFAPATPAVAFPIPAKPTSPVAADPPKEKTVEERLKDIDTKLSRLTELMDGKKDRDGFPLPSDPGLLAEVRRLKDDVASLDKQLKEMKSSTSLRPAADPMTGKGTVRVVNDYPVEIRIAVNNTTYTVAPNTKLDIPVPVGEFSYQLLNAGANLTPTRSPIKEKEVVTLRIK